MENTQWDNNYFDGLIQSRDKTAVFKATIGVMHKGILAQAISANVGREQITVTSGKLYYKPEKEQDWQIFETGDTFIIPAGTNFLWKVEAEDVCYECVYLDQKLD